MWKCFSRGLKGTFEKNIYKVNSVPQTKVTQDSKHVQSCSLLKFTPALTEQFNRFYGYYRTCSCGEGSKSKQRQDYNARKESCLDDLKYEWLGALQWSSVFMLGWYLCLPFRRRTTEHCPYRALSTQEYSRRLFEYLTRLIIVKPVNYVLPEVNAVKSSPPSKVEEKGLKNLEVAHNTVLGALSNWLGTESMQKGRHQEAVHHFSDAMNAGNASGAFNLGICYEMGLGISQDFNLAAELYKNAADLGHATAMYNLGVFHVQGWGGLTSDTNLARKLFEQAAALGQVDARKALNLTTEPEVPAVPSSDSKSIPVNYNTSHIKETDTSNHWYKLLNIQLDDVQNSTKKSRLVSTDSGILDLSPEDEHVQQLSVC